MPFRHDISRMILADMIFTREFQDTFTAIPRKHAIISAKPVLRDDALICRLKDMALFDYFHM